ncbi:MAG: isoprenylcysteine carboxylmethyltransferase family protein [Candidatus Acidiferrales bacterium]|jgi:protein-S-isoprenylcysteine O-methyltransferase Ste14
MVIRYIIQGLWLALLAYWLIGALRIKPAKQIEAPASRFSRMTLTILVFAFLLSPRGRFGWLGERFIPRSELAAVSGAIATAMGVGLAAWARYALGSNWSAAITLKESHELIRGGPYARIRHPIYSGVLLGLLGTALAMGEWRALVAVAVMFASYLAKAHREDSVLACEFGAAFQEHLRRTGTFLPRFSEPPPRP